ncbi:AAA family ATPase [Herbaspirillum huttiense]|uniref:AAA family ATPase n=1 Tax=Herbaspirillum huttiense TaxID=863372 RepID=UPI0010666DF8|nr:AAA family ATPase [Herbaspirillum huttiense]QBP77647.1 AAA family ATPase [Herbaspirillum huttiense]
MKTQDMQQKKMGFINYTVAHPHMRAALDTALAAVRAGGAGSSIVIVTGPTGVGKTTLARKLRQNLQADYQDIIDENPEQIPILYGNAVAAQGTSFSWKDFYSRLLKRSGEPLVERKLDIDHQQELFSDMPLARYRGNETADVLRQSVEICMRERKVRCLIIDEAHHILMVNDPKKLEFQFEAIKSLAIQTGAVIVLVGTYRLLDIRDQSGQLVRRSEIVHLPRYDVNTPSDVAKFKTALLELLEKIPVAHKLNGEKDAKHFYVKTGGEIGILKDWLVRAVDRFYQAGAKKFDLAFVDQYALDNKALRRIILEALEGEEKLRDIDENDLEALLMGEVPRSANAVSKRGRSAGRVGERKPVRDPVGGAYA